MEQLRIDHGSGYLALNVAAFFPCPIKKAHKVFPLINRWCSQEDRQELMAYLQKRADEYKAAIAAGEKRLRQPIMRRTEKKALLQCVQQNRRLLRRLQRNMELLEVT